MICNKKIKIVFEITIYFCIGILKIYSQDIHFNHHTCKYTISVPSNWSVIPDDSIGMKIKDMSFDIGLYPSNQKGYFSDSYVLINFIPTINSLNTLSFTEILSNFTEEALKTSEKQKEGNKKVKIDSITAYKTTESNYWINNHLTISEDSLQWKTIQALLLTKNGYISTLIYKKEKDSTSVSSILKDFINYKIIKLDTKFYYTPPSSSQFSIRNIFYSGCIGLIVYLIIIFLSKKLKGVRNS